MGSGGVDDTDSPFDRLHTAIANSSAYREALRASCPDLPDWLTPASVLNEADLNTIAADLEVVNGQTIIDLGCGAGGPGLWVAEKTGASLIGVDGSAAAVAIAGALAASRGMARRARFILADLAATGLPDEIADGVMSLDALMFVDPWPATREIRRLTKQGARVVVRSVESLIDPFTPTLVRDYRPIFESVGFTILRYEEVADYRDRSLMYFRAIEERAGVMYAEIGSEADILIDQARDSLEKAQKSPRVRTVFLVAQV
jgi:ubiquinone/menaquinone biosynthesis C-methylase UbiE